MVRASAVPGTDVVELAAEGADRELLGRIIEVWLAVYLERRAASRREVSDTAREDLQRQVDALALELQTKRAAIDDFRGRNEILSVERGDNQAAARLKQLNKALGEANQKAVETESRVEAVRADLAAGKVVLRPTDKAAIATLEGRARDLRETLKEAGTRYTDRYLAADPKYRSMRENLAALEGHIERQRAQSARALLDEAEQDLASAQATAARLRAQLDEHKRAAGEFTARYEEHKALQTELEQIEALYNATRERLVRVDLAQGQKAPEVQLLAPASVPGEPVRPLYLRDAGVSLGAAFALGLLAVWLVEFLGRTPREERLGVPTVQINLPPQSLGGPQPAALSAVESTRLDGPHGALLEGRAQGRLRAPEGPPAGPATGLPRELAPEEVTALWAASRAEGRIVLGGLLAGLSVEELADLRWEDMDLGSGRVRVGGASPRVLPLEGAFRRVLADAARAGSEQGESDAETPPGDRPVRGAGWVLASPDGSPLGLHAIEGLVAYAAYDAGLDLAAEVTPQVLRHTYVAYLVRQGLRFADVEQIVGRLPPAAYGLYARLAPSAGARASTDVQLQYPTTGDAAV
jgi:hypothetical protein